MKILFINLPYYGHVVPTIRLVQELLRKGCEVTYLMPFDWQDTVMESGAVRKRLWVLFNLNLNRRRESI